MDVGLWWQSCRGALKKSYHPDAVDSLWLVGCLYLRYGLCGWLSLPPDVTIKSSLRLKFLVWQPVCNLHFPSFHGKRTLILRHLGKQPWQFWDLSWVSKGFLLRNTPSRQGTMSACCFFPDFIPLGLFSKCVTRNPCGRCWGCYVVRLRLILAYASQYGGTEWITSHYEHPCWWAKILQGKRVGMYKSAQTVENSGQKIDKLPNRPL